MKLKAQVKRLCAENNWLRESLAESQQLLQEAEVNLGKLKVEKEHLEFLQSQKDGPRASLDFASYDQESEMIEGKGKNNFCCQHVGIFFSSSPSSPENPLSFQPEASSNLPQDLASLGATLDYEIPEKIRMLHQLALQHVEQVSNSTATS